MADRIGSIMEIYNDAKNYNNRMFDFGFNAETAPTKNVLGVIENEKVTMVEYPFNGIGVRKIMKGFDAVDFAIVEELGRSKYLSSIQIYQYIYCHKIAKHEQAYRFALKAAANPFVAMDR